jgi:ketosteroid isomerase-like protein
MTVTPETVSAWVDLYRAAWESNLADDIRAVFTEDAAYRGRPHEEPAVGHPAIVSLWIDNQDAPGTWSFEWDPVALEGDVAVIQCVTTYPAGDKGGTYDNLWVIRLADDGRAREFTDWWIGR